MDLRDVYNRNAAYWDSRLYRAVYHGAYIRLLRTLGLQGGLDRPRRVLDCGIGAGLLSEALLNIADWPVEINGVDLSFNLLTMSASKFDRRGTPAQLACADICRLPYRDRQMELVLSGLALEHVHRPVEAVREMTRVLEHGGLLLLVATRPGAPDHYYRWKYCYKPYPAAAFFDWMKQAGLSEVRAYPLTGIARFFARAYVGVKR